MGSLTVALFVACNVQDFGPLSVWQTYHPMKPIVVSCSSWGFPFPFLIQRAVVSSTPWDRPVHRQPLTFADFNGLAALVNAGVMLFVVGFVVAWGVCFGPVMHFKPIRRSKKPRRPIQFSLRTLLLMPLLVLVAIYLGQKMWMWAQATDLKVSALGDLALAAAVLFALFVE